MKFRIFLTIIVTSLLLTAYTDITNAAGYRIPANDYRKIDCGQMAHLITTVENLRQEGMSLEQAYKTVTPNNASTRAQLLHIIAISGFYKALGGANLAPEGLEQLESICIDTGIIQPLVISTNVACDTLDEISPIVNMLQSSGIPLQSTSRRVNDLVRHLPIFAPDTPHEFGTRILPSFFERYVSSVYNQTGQSASQHPTDFVQQCSIQIDSE